MIKGLIAVDLIFPEEMYFFGAKTNQHKCTTFPKRQKLRGKLRLVTSRPVKLSQVSVCLKGGIHLNWRDPLKSQHSILAEKVSATKTLRKSKNILLDQATLPAGVTELGFEMSLPGHLCPTFRTEYVDIQYLVLAKITPNGKFAKETIIQREVKIFKTLVPQDVCNGLVTGFVVPRLTMRGKRASFLEWKFRVPRWACLDSTNGVEFEGLFRQIHPDNQVTIEKIEVDVLQEELYRDDQDDPRVVKRHLTVSFNKPSIYIQPPLNTPIQFSFPLQSASHINTQEVADHDESTESQRNKLAASDASRQRTVSADGQVVIQLRNHLSCSLESPLLEVHHYIRLLVYFSPNPPHQHQEPIKPICIGLPIHITQGIRPRPDLTMNANELPSYQSIRRDEERLPDYVSCIQRDHRNGHGNHHDTQASQQRSSSRRGHITSQMNPTTLLPVSPDDEADITDMPTCRPGGRLQRPVPSSQRPNDNQPVDNDDDENDQTSSIPSVESNSLPDSALLGFLSEHVGSSQMMASRSHKINSAGDLLVEERNPVCFSLLIP